MARPSTLPFPLEEYQRRVSGLQGRMRARDLDALLVYTPENMYYLTGYQTTGYYVYQCLVVPADGAPIMVLRQSERTNVPDSCLERVESFNDVQDPVEMTCQTLRKYGLGDKRIGFEKDSWFLTVEDYERTLSLLPEANWGEGGDLVEQGRAIKSPLEIEVMREAGRIVAKGMQAGYDMAAPGRTENEVAGAVSNALITNGSVYFAGQPYIASGYRTGIAHATWSGRRLENNEPVSFEMSANVKRYSTALFRTIFLGKPTGEHRQMAEASLAGLNATIEAIKPGVTSGDVERACRDAIAKTGFADYPLRRCGYSIGIGFPPGWGEGHIMDLKSGDQRVLREGMTFHLVISVNKTNVPGMSFSETVLVTGDGCEPLTKEIPRELLVK